MQISYEIKKTADKGMGLFASQDIPKGTIIYRHQEGQFVTIRNLEELKKILNDKSDKFVQHFIDHTYCLNNELNYELDSCAFQNHTTEPNTGPYTQGSHDIVALQDVKAGDELTFDYRYYQRIDWYEDYYHELGFYDFIESLGECSQTVTTYDSIIQ